MRTHLRGTSIVVLLTYWISLIANPATAWAAEQTHGFSGQDAAKFTIGCADAGGSPDCGGCENFCEQFGRDRSGLSGRNTWSELDDVLCADLGVYTTGVRPSSAPIPAPSYNSCNYTLTPKIVDATGFAGKPEQACQRAAQFADHCRYHNSQVETQCMAVNAVVDKQDGAYAHNSILMMIDAGVAAACAYACAIPVADTASPSTLLGFEKSPAGVCGAMATAEGVIELASTIGMMTGKTQEYISAVGGGLGTGGGVATQATENLRRKKISNLEERKKQIGTQLSKAGASEAEKKAAEEVLEKADKELQKSKEAKTNHMACATAALFGVLFAIRVANLIQQRTAVKDACSNVDSLLGSFGGVTPPGLPPPPLKPGDPGYQAPPPNSNFGGRTVGNGAAITASHFEAYDACKNQGKSSSDCLASIGFQGLGGATDSNLLTPGAAEHALDKIPNLSAFVDKATRQGAGAALGSVLPASTGDLGAALVGLANAAQAEAPQLAAQLNMGSTYSAGGGGGSASSKSGSDNPFASLLGGGAGGGPMGAQGPGLASFGGPSQGPDIWHANTPMNLFEIVSDKLGKVSSRVK